MAERSRIDGLTGRLHVRRAKNGSTIVHPMQGDEIRALRRLQREQGPSSHVFMTERDGPMTPKAFIACCCCSIESVELTKCGYDIITGQEPIAPMSS